jgi:hypothetical protein
LAEFVIEPPQEKHVKSIPAELEVYCWLTCCWVSLRTCDNGPGEQGYYEKSAIDLLKHGTSPFFEPSMNQKLTFEVTEVQIDPSKACQFSGSAVEGCG